MEVVVYRGKGREGEGGGLVVVGELAQQRLGSWQLEIVFLSHVSL